MKLPLSEAKTTALFQLLDRLEALELRAVLVGGLVPPLLLAALDPDGVDDHPQPRHTVDCDLVLALPVDDAERRSRQIESVLADYGWVRSPRHNQFRWTHATKLNVDLMPVPIGVESGDARAIALAGINFPDQDPTRFYRGHELALADPIELVVEVVDRAPRSIAIAGLAALLAKSSPTPCNASSDASPRRCGNLTGPGA